MMLAAVLAATVKIGVFGLFHPVELDVEPVRGGVLVVESTQQTHILEGAHTLRPRASRGATEPSPHSS
jgi:hypothetical protein